MTVIPLFLMSFWSKQSITKIEITKIEVLKMSDLQGKTISEISNYQFTRVTNIEVPKIEESLHHFYEPKILEVYWSFHILLCNFKLCFPKRRSNAGKGTLTNFSPKKEMNLVKEFPPTGQKWAISFLDGRSGSRYIPLKA